MNIVNEESSYFSKVEKKIAAEHMQLAKQTIDAIVKHKDKEMETLFNEIRELKNEIKNLKMQLVEKTKK